MTRIKQTARALSREDGYTLPEFLTASALLIGLLAVMGGMIMVVVRAQPQLAERSAQIQSGRTMIERLTRELREGSGLVEASGSSLSFLTFVRTQACGSSEPPASSAVPAIQCRVRYTCTAGTCRRTESTPGGPEGAPVTLVEGLNSPASVFSYMPQLSPRHVTVTLEYPAEGGGESITLSDGAALRNAIG